MNGDIYFQPVRLSDDWRTQVWLVKCLCGREFSPRTTMYSHQEFQCPKCGREFIADWNEREVREAK